MPRDARGAGPARAADPAPRPARHPVRRPIAPREPTSAPAPCAGTRLSAYPARPSTKRESRARAWSVSSSKKIAAS